MELLNVCTYCPPPFALTQDETTARLAGRTPREGGTDGQSGPSLSHVVLTARKLGSVRSYTLKASYSLTENVKYAAHLYGLHRLGFLTLTFADDLQWSRRRDWKEAARRFHRFNRRVIPDLFDEYCLVVEPQASGRLHYHLLVVCRADIRTGIDFAAIAAGDYRTAPRPLRNLWARLRSACPAHGLGRSELLPVRSDAESIGRYLGGYLGKGAHAILTGLEDGKPPRVRRVRYSQGFKRAVSSPQAFAWAFGPAQVWRNAKAMFWAALNSVCPATWPADWSHMKWVYGSRWAYHMRLYLLGWYYDQMSWPASGDVTAAHIRAAPRFIADRLGYWETYCAAVAAGKTLPPSKLEKKPF